LHVPNDEELRALLDEQGLLREGSLGAPPPEAGFTVFAQATDARLPIDAWTDHAERFFGARVGLTVDKRYDGPPPREDAARVVVAPHGATPGTRLCYGRPRSKDDLARAEVADRERTGLADLARRCGYVWIVVREGEADRLALLLAAIAASVMLGPILSPDASELFGVKTARRKLESPSIGE
jgi:hypothetical protein